MTKIFPFTVRAYDTGHFIDQPRCRKSFLDQKPKDKMWYAFDVTVEDKDRNCLFTVYDMKDIADGGIGQKTFDFKGVLSESEYSELLKREIEDLAKCQEAVEYAMQRRNRIQEIAIELMKEVG